LPGTGTAAPGLFGAAAILNELFTHVAAVTADPRHRVRRGAAYGRLRRPPLRAPGNRSKMLPAADRIRINDGRKQ